MENFCEKRCKEYTNVYCKEGAEDFYSPQNTCLTNAGLDSLCEFDLVERCQGDYEKCDPKISGSCHALFDSCLSAVHNIDKVYGDGIARLNALVNSGVRCPHRH